MTAFQIRSFPSCGRKAGIPPGRPAAMEANRSASEPPYLWAVVASFGPNPPAPFSPWQLRQFSLKIFSPSSSASRFPAYGFFASAA